MLLSLVILVVYLEMKMLNDDGGQQEKLFEVRKEEMIRNFHRSES